MARLIETGRKFWRWFITPPSPPRLMKRVAWSLWMAPSILLFPFLLPILHPSSIPAALAENWEGYLLFFGLPYSIGAALWVYDNRAGGS
jgi:hypothetical protein